jgi:hypothetical protein
MTALSDTVIRNFCDLCDWAHQAWLIRKHLFDENTRASEFGDSKHRMFFYRLSEITQDYWVHQVVKLHDPAVLSGQINLSINYIIEYGGWDSITEQALQALNKKMSPLAEKLKVPRNKVLSHNDLRSIVQEAASGSFIAGADVEYFSYLQDFVNLLSSTTRIGGPHPFDITVVNDVSGFLARWENGLAEETNT